MVEVIIPDEDRKHLDWIREVRKMKKKERDEKKSNY
jgi:hypothetical protein